MLRRKRTDVSIVRIHKRRAGEYVRMALDAEYREKVEKARAKLKWEKENPELAAQERFKELERKEKEREEAAKAAAKEREKAETEKISAGIGADRNIQFSIRETSGVRYCLKKSEEHYERVRQRIEAQDKMALEAYGAGEKREYLRSVDDCLNEQGLEFGEIVKRICEIKQMKASEVYKTALIDRRLYSKVTKDRSYYPGRDTCIAIAFGLRLSFEEAGPFLKKAGYALSDSIRRDIIFEYCFKNRVHDVYDVNEILEEMGEKML